MLWLCRGGLSLESALRKGDVDAVIAALGDDPLPAACRTFRAGDTIWHIAANGGHVVLLAALVHRLREVLPTSPLGSPGAPSPHSNAGGPSPTPSQDGGGRASIGVSIAGAGVGFGAGTGGGVRRHAAHFSCSTNPFQRLSDGLLGPRPDPCSTGLAGWLSAPNALGQTPLMSAARRGHAEAVKYLLSVGASPWARDRGQCSVLHYAALGDCGAAVAAVLQHPASARPPPGEGRPGMARLVDLPNAWGYTSAHFAAAAGKPAALAALLAGGANLAARCWGEGHDWITGARGYTPLHLAARRCDTDMCKMIMRHYLEALRDSGSVDPRLLADWRGVRPFSLALERGNKALAEILMPSTPLPYIFAGSESVRLYAVPKLKALASAALQEALLTQIAAAEAAVTARRQRLAEVGVAEARAAAEEAVVAAAGGAAASGDGFVVADGGGGGSAMLRASSSLAATVSGALDAVRRQSLRLQQRLRVPRAGRRQSSTEAAKGGGDGGDDGFGATEAALLRCSEDYGRRMRSVATAAAPRGHEYAASCSQQDLVAGGSPPYVLTTAEALASPAASGVMGTSYNGTGWPSSVGSAAAVAGTPWLCGGSPPAPFGQPSLSYALPGGASPPLPGGASPIRGGSYDLDCSLFGSPPPMLTTRGAAASAAASGPASGAAAAVARQPPNVGMPVASPFAQYAQQAPPALVASLPPLVIPSSATIHHHKHNQQQMLQQPHECDFVLVSDARRASPLQPGRPPSAGMPTGPTGAAGSARSGDNGRGGGNGASQRACAHEGLACTACNASSAATQQPNERSMAPSPPTPPPNCVAGSGEDVVGGSPRATLWSRLASLGRGGQDNASSALGSGAGGGAGAGAVFAEVRGGSGRLMRTGSRPVSGTLSRVGSGGGGGAATADGAAEAGSDTSENCCGVCLERPALVQIRPCRHVLCAECCREVTRMVETQPPSCPFCRGLVRGFDC